MSHLAPKLASPYSPANSVYICFCQGSRSGSKTTAYAKLPAMFDRAKACLQSRRAVPLQYVRVTLCSEAAHLSLGQSHCGLGDFLAGQRQPVLPPLSVATLTTAQAVVTRLQRHPRVQPGRPGRSSCRPITPLAQRCPLRPPALEQRSRLAVGWWCCFNGDGRPHPSP